MDINGSGLEQAVQMSLLTVVWWGDAYREDATPVELCGAKDGGIGDFLRQKKTDQKIEEFKKAVELALSWLKDYYPDMKIIFEDVPGNRINVEVILPNGSTTTQIL